MSANPQDYIEAYARAVAATSFMHDEPWRSRLGLQIGDRTTVEGVTKLRELCERLDRENQVLRAQLNTLFH